MSVPLLLYDASRLINSNAKLQTPSGDPVSSPGFEQAPLMPQLFIFYNSDRVTAMLAKVVDEILLVGQPSITDPLIERIKARFLKL